MSTIPFVPGATAGALINRQNCDTGNGPIGCTPSQAPGNTDWVAWCSKSDFMVDITTEVDQIAGINSCVRVPAQRKVTGAVGTVKGCRLQDAAFLTLIDAATELTWTEADPPAPIAADDVIGWAMKDFGSTDCQSCGGGCDYFSLLLWMCAFPIQGCATALPRGIYALLALPSFQLTQPKDMPFGGDQNTVANALNFELDIYNLDPNISWFPCDTGVAGDPQRGPILPGHATPVVPDLLGLDGSPLACFLTDQAPPIDCDCCGAAGFWSTGSPTGLGLSVADAIGHANGAETLLAMEEVAGKLKADHGKTTEASRAKAIAERIESEKA